MPRLGQYELVEELGRGSMGVVYRGFDPLIRRDVAIKTILLWNAAPAVRAHLEERLAREAQSAGRLSHPNIVTIYQVGYETIESGQPMAYIVMEYVAGQTLGERLQMTPALDRGAILNILWQTAEALDYAHSQGVIHRDVKPANLLLSQDGRVKVADFGIAMIASESMTETGAMLGTPHYMAPEQVRAEALDGRADQFSLAVVAFELLTGQRPFMAELVSALAYQIAHQDTPIALLVNAGLPPATVQVFCKAMAKQARDRYSGCREMVVALRDSLYAPLYATPMTQRPAVNWAGWAAGLAIPLLLVTSGAGWFLYSGGRSTGRASSPSAQASPAVAPAGISSANLRPADISPTEISPAEISAQPTAPPPVNVERPSQIPAPPVTPVAPPASVAPQPVRLPAERGTRTPPSVLRKVDPEYTESARKAGVEGMVSMRVRVTPAGNPEQIEVVKGLEPTLDQRAVEALTQWRFNPGLAEDGTPISWTAIVQVSFQLLDGPKAGTGK